MRRAIVTSLEIYVVSSIIFSLLYYLKPRPLDWHHYFAYLTLVSFIALTITGAIMMRSDPEGRYRKLHIIFGIFASLALIATILTFRYGLM
ncbi:MAG: hypothetical protein ACE5PM_08850 [Candidatus Hydrothermarchaeales archaeon]